MLTLTDDLYIYSPATPKPRVPCLGDEARRVVERQGGATMPIIITCTRCGAVLDEVEAPGVEKAFTGGLCAECREKVSG